MSCCYAGRQIVLIIIILLELATETYLLSVYNSNSGLNVRKGFGGCQDGLPLVLILQITMGLPTDGEGCGKHKPPQGRNKSKVKIVKKIGIKPTIQQAIYNDKNTCYIKTVGTSNMYLKLDHQCKKKKEEKKGKNLNAYPEPNGNKNI